MKTGQRTEPAQRLLDQSDQYRRQGCVPEALACLQRAVEVAPSDAIAHCKRGQLLGALRRWDESLAYFDRGLSLQPGLAPAHLDCGNILQEKGLLEEALASYNRALALQSRYAPALCNRGTVLHRLHRLDESIASYDAALALEPGLEVARFNRSTTLADAGRYAEALEGFERTLALFPNLAVAHWNEALCRLRLGDFARGLPKFEWRWRYADRCLRARDYPQPIWLGQNELTGLTILLYAEQGLGDTIQFSRYVHLLVQRGARVVLEAPRPLAFFLKTLFRDLPGTHAVVTEGDTLPEFDCHTPLMSLPLALGTTVQTIPAPVPYLHVDAIRNATWAQRLGARPMRVSDPRMSRLRVGLAWSGNERHPCDYNRSLTLRQLRILTNLVDVEFIALQNKVRDGDAEELARQEIRYFGTELHDFGDSAALAANLDLVISVDSAPAHLAGAIGLPVWNLLPCAPDWRWLLERNDSPWYPSARLFRQSTLRDWDNVLAQVRNHLEAFVAGKTLAQPTTPRID